MKGKIQDTGCIAQLIAFLTILIVIIIIAKFTFKGLPEYKLENFYPTATFSVTQTVTPTVTSKIGYKISIKPEKMNLQPEEEFKVGIFLRPYGERITLVDISMMFNSEKLKVTEASSSSFFEEQVEFINEIYPDGRIRVSLGSLIPATRSGMLFVITGNVLPSASGSAQIKILPESRVVGEGSLTPLNGSFQSSEIKIDIL